MDDGVGLSRARAQALDVLERAAMRLHAGLHKRPGAGVRPCKPQHPMPGGEKFGNDARTDEAGGAGQKYAHGMPPMLTSEAE